MSISHSGVAAREQPQACLRVRALRPTLDLFIVLLALITASCSHAPTGHTTGAAQVAQSGATAPAEVVGPPEPEVIQGPTPPLQRKVVLMLGPGMAAALGGAGVIRALVDSKIEIAAVAGVEFGALVGASYASTGTLPAMDWKLMQIRPEWLAPGRGLLGKSRPSFEGLKQGVSKVFLSVDLSDFRIPSWILIGGPGAQVKSIHRGPAAEVLAVALAQPETMDPPGTGTTAAAGWGDVLEKIRQQGLDAPRVWVVSRLDGAWPHAAALSTNRETKRWVSEQDLVVELDPPQDETGPSPWLFSRRSSLVYQGRQAARRVLPAWEDRMGWSGSGDQERGARR